MSLELRCSFDCFCLMNLKSKVLLSQYPEQLGIIMIHLKARIEMLVLYTIFIS